MPILNNRRAAVSGASRMAGLKGLGLRLGLGLACLALAGPTAAAQEQAARPGATESGVVSETSASARVVRAVVTVAPLRSIVEPLLPAGSTVTVLMSPGRSEHGYEFSASDLAAVASADLVVYVGLNLEPRIAEAVRTNPVATREAVVFAEVVGFQDAGKPEPNSADGTPKACCALKEGMDDDEGHEHAKGWVDQHLWLDPVLMEKLVPAVHASVARVLDRRGVLDAATRTTLDTARDQLLSRVAGVDARWKSGIAQLPSPKIVTHHNAFSRTAERYGFEVAAVIKDFEGREPKASDIAGVVRTIRAEKVRAVFVEPQFNPQLAQRIAQQARVRLAQLDPLGTGDWFATMDANLQSITTALGE